MVGKLDPCRRRRGAGSLSEALSYPDRWLQETAMAKGAVAIWRVGTSGGRYAMGVGDRR